MSKIAACMNVILVFQFAVCCAAGEVARKNLQQVMLQDGSLLVLFAEKDSDSNSENSICRVVHYPKGSPGYFKQESIWRSEAIATLRCQGADASQYALVALADDQIQVFCTWNEEYTKLDRSSGKVLLRGRGDDILLDSKCCMPIRVTVVDISGESTGKTFSDEELRELAKQEEKLRKEAENFEREHERRNSKE